MGKLCLRGDPRVCGQFSVFARPGVVGQRLAPVSKTRTNNLKEELS